MNEWAKSVPLGMRDYLFKEAKARRGLTQAICGVFGRRGYCEAVTPVLEYYDVYNQCGDAFSQEDMYKLFDSKGRVLVLRHDMTVPIARMAATKLAGSPLPIKFFYSQSVVRANSHFKGKQDEEAQCGVELIGSAGRRADLEIIITAIEAMKAADCGEFTIEIGHIGFFAAASKEISDNPELLEEIRESLESKNFAALADITKKFDPKNPGIRAIRALPNLFGGPEILKEARSIAPNREAVRLLDDLEEICQTLKELGYEKYITIDLGIVHHINYYTGLVFTGYLQGAGDPCLKGGRYDKLYEKFGAAFPAVGFGINLDSLMRAAEKNGAAAASTHPDVVIHYEKGRLRTANDLLHDLAQDGSLCELSVYETEAESRAYAKARGVTSAFYAVTKYGVQKTKAGDL